MFIVEIEQLENDAFAQDCSIEIARILSEVANRVDDAMITGITVNDINGNLVCHAWLSPLKGYGE